jgi:hypothetical protein
MPTGLSFRGKVKKFLKNKQMNFDENTILDSGNKEKKIGEDKRNENLLYNYSGEAETSPPVLRKRAISGKYKNHNIPSTSPFSSLSPSSISEINYPNSSLYASIVDSSSENEDSHSSSSPRSLKSPSNHSSFCKVFHKITGAFSCCSKLPKSPEYSDNYILKKPVTASYLYGDDSFNGSINSSNSDEIKSESVVDIVNNNSLTVDLQSATSSLSPLSFSSSPLSFSSDLSSPSSQNKSSTPNSSFHSSLFPSSQYSNDNIIRPNAGNQISSLTKNSAANLSSPISSSSYSDSPILSPDLLASASSVNALSPCNSLSSTISPFQQMQYSPSVNENMKIRTKISGNTPNISDVLNSPVILKNEFKDLKFLGIEVDGFVGFFFYFLLFSQN